MKDIARMVIVLAIVCLAAALGLSKIYGMTKAPIAEAMRQEKLSAIKAVLPAYENQPDVDAAQSGGVTYYIGISGGSVTGVAFEVSSMQGYSGLITAMVGVNPAGEVTGVRILSHAETPGLGAKFADEGYLAMFIGKNLEGTNWAVRKDGGDFDQITGATISPRALVSAVKAGLEGFNTAKSSLGIDRGGE
ncbi:MAG: electron transporter RnfG [Deltaproteobacteria bacterium]|nr:MAG: electron transporter RnfG [Deltaproteobacteria bacterium]